ncbi:hypothetical protein EJ06DRAFT_521328 [Trichodelitschia bisporula]|uniref:Uncharacterized protein n=1 Tax=Trichodelitschia bisporula TaxID=703511 RepID=A0A6G1HX99_9PEZI|nr:hypothetical protein EJ06DRAFT_521328 [Trichodelitschia bisporula]
MTSAGPSTGASGGQVTSFILITSDDERIYGWHILPLDVYERCAAPLAANPVRELGNFNKMLACKLMIEDAEFKAIVNSHINASHNSQMGCSATYKLLTSLPNTYVLTLAYRGFVHSTGSPRKVA